MKRKIERHHWLNTIVGLLDAAFYLSDEEQYLITDIVNRLLISLRIPERSAALELPPAVALEYKSSFYSALLAGPRISGRDRPVNFVTQEDIIVSVESWRQAFLDMLLISYPNLEPIERLVTAKALTEILVAIGVPNRAAAFYPDAVVRAYQEGPDATWRD